MRLIEMLSIIPDWQDVVVCRENGDAVDAIAIYDGAIRIVIDTEMNISNPWDGLFELATVKDVVEAFSPALISIENDDSRECPPVDWDTFKRLFRGTDVLRTACREIVVDDKKNHFKIWLV